MNPEIARRLDELHQQRLDNQERATELVYDAVEELRRMVRTGTIFGPKAVADVGMRLSDALVLFEAGGIPTPRLPTPQEMER